MIRYWLVFAFGLITLGACAAGPALSQGQGRRAEPRRGRQPLGAYVIHSEDEARQRLEAGEQGNVREQPADLSDRVSRTEGRLEGMEGADERAATASEEASKSAQRVIDQVGTCTKLVSVLVVLVVGGLGLLGYRSLRGIAAAARAQVEAAVQKAQQASRQAEDALRRIEETASAFWQRMEAEARLRWREEWRRAVACALGWARQASQPD